MKRLITAAALALALAPAFGKTINVGGQSSVQDIQSAIDMAKSGDVILVAAGLYETTETLVVEGKKNLTIRGKGAVDIVCTLYVHVMTISNSAKIAVEGLHMVHSYGAEVINCDGANVLRVENSDQISVTNCELNGCGNVGIYASNTPNLTATGNYIHSNTMYGVYYEDGPEGSKGVLTLKNNRILNNSTPIAFLDNSVYEDSNENRRLKMSGNRIYPGPRLDWDAAE